MFEQDAGSRVLVVDDEENIRHYLRLLLEREGFTVATAATAEEGLRVASSFSPVLILCDVRMPGGFDGLGLLERIRELPMDCDVIMMSAYGSRETAIEAVQRGAYDYIEKPIQRDDLVLVLLKFFERERLRRENRRLKAALRGEAAEDGLIASAESMQKVLQKAHKVAPFPSTVLISGESGTGKELLARLIHRRSERQDGPFVAVNCGSIPDNLLESELFGHAKGAFTGAHKERIGLFEAADKGTLFLDEVSELPHPLQVKLLRVLQEGALRRLGETTMRSVEVRIVAATNRNLQEEVDAGHFRKDLYYRLNVVSLALPPLRERREDIPALVDAYIERFNARFGTSIQGATPEVMRCLMTFSWPGNVRQLKNVIESAIVLEEGSHLSLPSLPAEFSNAHAPSPLTRLLSDEELSIKKACREIEAYLIRQALAKTDGNRTAASRLLEISHRALLYKIKEYEIP